MATDTEPTIPLVAAEFLHIALVTAKQSQHLDENAKHNIGIIVATYECKRDEHCMNNGMTAKEIHKVQTAVALEMAEWLEDRAQQAEEEDTLEELEKCFDAEQAPEGDHPQGADPNR